jgi:hypothetical protein
MNELVFEGQLLLFPKAKQNVSVLNFPIWFADSLELELSGRLEGLDAFPGYDRRFGGVSIQRSPINFGFGIGVPDREYDDVSLPVIDNGFGRRTDAQGARRQGLEFVDPVEVNLFSVGGLRDESSSRTE